MSELLSPQELSPQERLDLLRTLSELPPSIFAEIRIGIGAHKSLLPREDASSKRRSIALFDWAMSPIGPGEIALKQLADSVIEHYRENLVLPTSEDDDQIQGQPIRLELLNGASLDLVHIPAGYFLMGSLGDEPDREASEGPQHPVTVSEFYLSTCAVTQAQWSAVALMAKIDVPLLQCPSLREGSVGDVSQSGDHPVENISWYEAVEFCNRITTALHQSEQYRSSHCRLPTEAEWEYACRAGSQTRYCFGDTITPGQVNYAGAVGQTTPVGAYACNDFGLFDMHGNVWEWCLDPWHESYGGAPYDGSVWAQNGRDEYRVIRGGSWFNEARHCRSAYRNCLSPEDRSAQLGFRIVLAHD